ncbi:MAG: energy-coupling factor transporter transmembrane component T family protein [Roseinatronobacter sp.]
MSEGLTGPRARLVIALVLAFGFASIRGLAVLPVIVVLAGVIVLGSGQVGAVLRRLRGPALLALVLGMALAMMSGQTVLVQWGPLTLRQEGVQAAALIAGRLLAIVAVTLALLSALSAFQLVEALRALRVPALMADLALLTLRYLEEASAELRRAHLARHLRGGKRGWRALPDHAALLAMGLIRAQVRSERLWAAMRLRGYGTGVQATASPLRKSEWLVITAAVIMACGVIWLDRSL